MGETGQHRPRHLLSYVAGRWAITMLFSLKVLYNEHGFGPNLLWGLGPGQDVFPMRFYRWWRRFKQHLSQSGGHETTRAPPVTVPHEYLALNEVELPQLPRRNQTRSNVYPMLPSPKHTPVEDEGPPVVAFVTPERQAPAGEALPCQQPLSTDLHPGPGPIQPPLVISSDPIGLTPPAADVCPAVAPLPSAAPAVADGLVGLPTPRAGGLFRSPEDTFPKGPI